MIKKEVGMKVKLFILLLFSFFICYSSEVMIKKLVIKDHLFEPKELIIPEGIKVKLIIKNEDLTVEEFESFDLKREKIIPGNTEVTVSIGPLKKGIYKFFGEFNPKTAQGTIIVE